MKLGRQFTLYVHWIYSIFKYTQSVNIQSESTGGYPLRDMISLEEDPPWQIKALTKLEAGEKDTKPRNR